MYYKRKWNCSICKQPVYYDDILETLICKCITIPNVKLPEEALDNFQKEEESPTVFKQRIDCLSEKIRKREG